MRPPATGVPDSSPRLRKLSVASSSSAEGITPTAGGPMAFWLAREDEVQPETGVISMPTSTPLTPLPLTPTNASSPGTAGWIHGTPKSMSLGSSIRLSEDGDVESTGNGADESNHLMSSGAPELVMPSLAMPARRPFTDRGKKMSRLRVCVAGRKGVGKTSLIRAIVRQCEDIVQVDALTTTPTYVFTKRDGKMKRKRADGTSQVTEIMASTKAYPSWWAGSVKDSQTLRRRKSGGDGVLERNLCFIDTPGFLVGDGDKMPYSNQTLETQTDTVVDYIEEQLWKTETFADISDADRLNMISGRGAALVDVVLFLFSEGQSNSVNPFEAA
jgi:GTPase SAR1 family protein